MADFPKKELFLSENLPNLPKLRITILESVESA